MYSAIDIAYWFLTYNDYIGTCEVEEDGDVEPITNLKLQKLLYYAQSACLALKDRPLFHEDVIAWRHGPVVPEVYHTYKKNEGRGIEEYKEGKPLEPEDEELLREVFSLFGSYSAWGLRNLTHQEDPWKNTQNGGVISHDAMQTYFKEHYVS